LLQLVAAVQGDTEVALAKVTLTLPADAKVSEFVVRAGHSLHWVARWRVSFLNHPESQPLVQVAVAAANLCPAPQV